MSTIIKLERPDTADAVELITELETHLETLYPHERRRGYSVEKLIAPFGSYVDDPLSLSYEKRLSTMSKGGDG